MKRSTIIILAVVLAVVVVLLLPLIFKKRIHRPLLGPDISELEYTEVFFDNSNEQIKLAGMLILPQGPGPFPTAVVIHGSGTSKRDEVWYISVAKYLQANGIAVLLPDKRGCEKSEGQWVGASFEELATDTASAVEFIRHQKIFRCSSIGVIGFSQGGWIAPVVASQTEGVSFVVSMSGAAVTVAEQLLYQETTHIAQYTYTHLAKLIAVAAANRVKRLDHVLAFVGFDPLPYWKRVRAPVFFAFGRGDTAVPVEASINRLKENDLDHFKVKEYAGGGHVIRDTQTNTVSEEYLRDLTEFIKAAEL